MTLYKSPKNIALLLWPSLRSVAYLQVLDEANYFPNEIIVLKNDFDDKVNPRFIKESKKYNYKSYFDIEKSIGGFLNHKDCNVIKLNTSDINDPAVINATQKLNNKYIIFTGGGILRKDILSLQKVFIHIHPGIIPEYRGSTCFYYSLLENYSLGSTVYFMNENIDAGEIIIQRNFTLNYFIHSDQIFFVDYILDNYIRSQALKETVNLFHQNDQFNTKIKDCSGFAYYIMHPLLRHLTIEKINAKYSKYIDEGVIMV